ncbi:MAG TPA: DUF397 domain-containing protein [Mycobacteriales bacterium]|jgi:Domain of unknown function (DUF397).
MAGQDLGTAVWRKSSHSGSDGQCVEVAFVDARRVAVRDSKNPAGPVLLFTGAEWATFVATARTDRFDR